REQRGELIHLVERTRIRLVEREEPLPGRKGLARIITPFVVELRERLEELAPPDAVDLLDALFVGVREVVPARRRDGEPIELFARVAVVGVERERLLQAVEGLVQIVPALLEQARGIAQHRDLLVRATGDLVAVEGDVDELLPVIGLLVNRTQELDR